MTHPDIDMAAATAAARDILRDQVDRIEQARASQPARLAAARTEADEAREQSLLIEPWSEQLSALRAHTRDGQPTAQTLPLPNVIAKEMFGARLAFDLLDAGTDDDRRADHDGRESAHLAKAARAQFGELVGVQPAWRRTKADPRPHG